MTGDSPRFPSEDNSGNAGLEQQLAKRGLKFEKTTGSYGGPENSYIVHQPTREAMYQLGHQFGQEAIVFGQDGKHELLYTHGPNAGKYHPGLPLVRFSQEKPEDYFTTIPGKGHVTLHFDADRLHDSPVKSTVPAMQHGPGEAPHPRLEAFKSEARMAVLRGLRKALGEHAPRPHPHAYAWHESNTSYHHRTIGHGILLSTKQFTDLAPLAKSLRKDEAPQAPKPHPTNEQAAGAGVSTYAKYAAPYGSVNKGSASDLKHYPMEGTSAKVDQLIKDHGHTVYYAGGKHGKADLANKNFDSRHLMIWDPSAGSGGDFGHADYTDNWRKIHELAHSLTLPELNAKYGEGRRMGGLGKQRTLREAKRAVEWEHLAAHRQRQLASSIGINIPDDVFNREYNTVMHDAVHRAVTGRFTEPSEEGFTPHSHQVPLSVAHSMLDEHANSLGLVNEHSLIKKNESQSFTHRPKLMKKSEKLYSPREVHAALVKTVREKLDAAAAQIEDLRKRELAQADKKSEKPLSKAELCPLCGNLDRPGSCTCILRKDEDEPKSKACPNCSKDVTVSDGKVGHHFEGRQAKPCAGVGKAPKGLEKDEKDPGPGNSLGPSFACPKCHTFQNSYAGRNPEGKKTWKCKKCGDVRATDESMNKDEMVPNSAVADDKKVPGSVLPSDKMPKKVGSTEGSGGKITKKSEKGEKGVASLRKDAMGSLMGKDKWKKPGSMGAPTLPGMTAPTKVNGMHPDTAASLADVKGLAPSAAKPAAAAPKLPAVAPATAKPTLPGAKPAPAAAAPAGNPDADLAADKKAAGVGFLNNLISKFKGVGNAGWKRTATHSPKFSGVRPLARSEKKADQPLKKSMGNCLLCKADEHGGACKASPSNPRPGKTLKVEPAPQTEGLTMTNHSRGMMGLDHKKYPGIKPRRKARRQ